MGALIGGRFGPEPVSDREDDDAAGQGCCSDAEHPCAGDGCEACS